MKDYAALLRKLPTKYARTPEWRGRPMQEVVAATADEEHERVTAKTAKRHVSALGKLFEYLADERKLFVGPNPAHGTKVGKKQGKGKVSRSPRAPWSTADLVALFTSPVWTGCHPFFRTRPGDQIIRDAKFWLPLLGLYHGNRLEEFAQLRREDIKREDSVWVCHLTAEGERHLKTPSAWRRVPLHPQLERWGFMQYVGDPTDRPEEFVFPDLQPRGLDDKLGVAITKWFTNYRRAIGVYRKWLDYHAFRHGAVTQLLRKVGNRALSDYLTGHGGQGTSQVVYFHGDTAPAVELRAAIATVSFPEAEDALRHLEMPSAATSMGDRTTQPVSMA